MNKKNMTFYLKTFFLLLLGTFFSLPHELKAQQIAVIDHGTYTYTTYNPISVGGYRWWEPYVNGAHMQIMYTAEQLQAAGGVLPGMLDSIAWDIAELPLSALKDYTIKIGTTSQPNLEDFLTTGLTTAVTLPSYMPSDTGWAWIAFSTPVFWNGVDNIVIDICSDTTQSEPSGLVRGYEIGTWLEDYYWVTATSENPLCGTFTNTISSGNMQVNIKLAFSDAPACTGTPVTGIISADLTGSLCALQSVFMELGNAPESDVSFLWEMSIDGGAWQPALGYNIGTGYDAIMPLNSTEVAFRVKITCPQSELFSVSNEIVVDAVPGATFATLPYEQDFENWISRCDSLEIPDQYWAAAPVHGNASWRREDQGGAAGWTESVTPNYYNPVSSEGSHSARYRGSSGAVGGSLLLHVDCSGPGVKELRFDHMNKTTTPNSNMEVFISEDGGITFELLETISAMGVVGQWQSYIFPFTSTSAETIFKFTGNGVSQWGDFDMGIDNLKIYAPCEDAPVAGMIDAVSVCEGEGVILTLSDNSLSSGMEYVWQLSVDGINWNDALNGNEETLNTSMNEETWYRCIVTCSNSELSDTTAPRLITLSPFYSCYCASSSTVASADLNIGNVKLITESGIDTLIDNGNPLPATSNLEANKHYSDFTYLSPAEVFVDSSYILDLTYFTSNGTNVFPQMGRSYTKIWIDYNQNGQFDNEEIIWFGEKPEAEFSTNVVFTIPADALPGITGMRILTNGDYDSTSLDPCGSYSYGETEDYLVKINSLPCDGSVEGGYILSSESVSCPDYPVHLSHTDFEVTAGPITRIWQKSTDQTNWNEIPGTENLNDITLSIDDNTWFRVKLTCIQSAEISYSEVINVNLDEVCFCVSYADGGVTGAVDSSDIGGFSISPVFANPLSGGHLNNALAVNGYTRHANAGTVELYADSAYEFIIDHTLLRGTHGDARITMFIDYNANGVFDLPEEKVYDEISEATTWHKTGTISIPADVQLNTPTLLRIVLNNDLELNSASDEGCGIYTSGETEDLIVSFKDKEVGISEYENTSLNIHIFPNPSNGYVTMKYTGERLLKATVSIQTVVGTVLHQETFEKIENREELTFDLSTYAKGVYIIKLENEKGKVTKKVIMK